MLVLIILAAVWAAVLLPPFLRNRRDGRPDNSVVSFRAQLSTLERATPGTSLRPGGSIAPTRMTRSDVKRRRLEVLLVLAGATAVTLVLALALKGVFLLTFVATAGALGAYVFALRQIHVRAIERDTKVRVLVPRTTATPAPAFNLRRTVSG